MTSRGQFVKQLPKADRPSTMPGALSSRYSKNDGKIWAILLHLSFNFAAGIMKPKWGNGPRKEFEPDESLWNDVIKNMAAQNLNMVVINLDDSVLWDSHPEISLRNSWTPDRMREELGKIRKLGIEPIPMLNFSATHDAWLGKYARMLSTAKYYEVCKDLIAEAIDIFDTPRFFHLGMDEETAQHQRRSDYIVIRQNDLWWADLYFYIAEVMKKGVRPWVWSDYLWHHPEKFFKMMPKSVIQSNWYYGENFDMNKLDERRRKYVNAYIELNRHGYDQIPTGSNDQNNPESIGNTVDFCGKHIDEKRLLGFLQTLWMPTIEKFRRPILQAVDLIGEARKNYERKY